MLHCNTAICENPIQLANKESLQQFQDHNVPFGQLNDFDFYRLINKRNITRQVGMMKIKKIVGSKRWTEIDISEKKNFSKELKGSFSHPIVIDDDESEKNPFFEILKEMKKTQVQTVTKLCTIKKAETERYVIIFDDDDEN